MTPIREAAELDWSGEHMKTTTNKETFRDGHVRALEKQVIEYALQRDKYKAQRDELLSAIKELCDVGFNTVTSRNANAAIAKVEADK